MNNTGICFQDNTSDSFIYTLQKVQKNLNWSSFIYKGNQEEH